MKQPRIFYLSTGSFLCTHKKHSRTQLCHFFMCAKGPFQSGLSLGCQKFYGSVPVHVSNFSKRAQYFKTTNDEVRDTLRQACSSKVLFFFCFYVRHPNSHSTSTEPFLHTEVEIQTLEVSSNDKIEVLVSLGKRRVTFYPEVLEERLTTLMMELIVCVF